MHDFTEPIIHIDMDAFFVEAERLRRPELVGIPVVVGGAGDRGVVAAASYEAREFGVRSAMPMVTARRSCPGLTVVPGDHSYYRDVSRQVFSILRGTTPQVEGLSIDEAFLDVAGLRRHFGSPLDVAAHIRDRIRAEVGLPSSAGVAAVKFIAKIASDAAKPDGMLLVPHSEQVEFLHALPVRDLWGVGEATFAKLDRFGVATIGDLARLPERSLIRALGPSLGAHLHRLAWAQDERPIVTDSEAKSISIEETFSVDVTGIDSLETELLRLADQLGYRLHVAGVAGRTVTLKLRFSDFTTITRSHTLDHATGLAREIFHEARRLMRPAVGVQAVRLLGVGVSSLVEAEDRQLSFDSPADWDDLDEAIGRVRDRFGVDVVRPARLGSTGPHTRVQSALPTEVRETYTGFTDPEEESPDGP